MAKAFNPSVWEAEQADLHAFKASLVYISSSRIVRLHRERPCLKIKQTNKKPRNETVLGLEIQLSELKSSYLASVRSLA